MIIIKAGVPDKRGRLERLPAAVLPTHYCNERQRVAMATRGETHVGCSSSLSFFFLRPSPSPLFPPRAALRLSPFLPHVSLTLLAPSLALSLSHSLSPPEISNAPFSPVSLAPFDLLPPRVESGMSLRAALWNISNGALLCGRVRRFVN